ncbi:MAG: hypothetical protein KDK66_08970, partial [Deltaproteobacteria bacterium]|nr:hypothetical protein [Deltaproteobacteria bacterium]
RILKNPAKFSNNIRLSMLDNRPAFSPLVSGLNGLLTFLGMAAPVLNLLEGLRLLDSGILPNDASKVAAFAPVVGALPLAYYSRQLLNLYQATDMATDVYTSTVTSAATRGSGLAQAGLSSFYLINDLSQEKTSNGEYASDVAGLVFSGLLIAFSYSSRFAELAAANTPQGRLARLGLLGLNLVGVTTSTVARDHFSEERVAEDVAKAFRHQIKDISEAEKEARNTGEIARQVWAAKAYGKSMDDIAVDILDAMRENGTFYTLDWRDDLASEPLALDLAEYNLKIEQKELAKDIVKGLGVASFKQTLFEELISGVVTREEEAYLVFLGYYLGVDYMERALDVLSDAGASRYESLRQEYRFYAPADDGHNRLPTLASLRAWVETYKG